jgi:hypothetical protein
MGVANCLPGLKEGLTVDVVVLPPMLQQDALPDAHPLVGLRRAQGGSGPIQRPKRPACCCAIASSQGEVELPARHLCQIRGIGEVRPERGQAAEGGFALRKSIDPPEVEVRHQRFHPHPGNPAGLCFPDRRDDQGLDLAPLGVERDLVLDKPGQHPGAPEVVSRRQRIHSGPQHGDRTVVRDAILHDVGPCTGHIRLTMR